MGRKKGTNQELQQHARGRLRTKFSDWILNPHDQEDFGFDFEVRLTEPDNGFFSITPNSFLLQLKSSEEFDNPDNVHADLDVDYLTDDCLEQSVPVALLIYERARDDFYWCILQSYCWDVLDEENAGWRDQQSVRIHPESEPLPGTNEINSHAEWGLRNKFRRKLEEAEDRIALRRHIDALEHYSQGNQHENQTHLASTDDIKQYKREKLDSADQHLKTGAKSQAFSELFDIYRIPERDELTLEAIIKLLKSRNIDHPAIAFIQDEFTEEGMALFRR